MKLRNKKTGKIGNLGYSFTNDLCVSWQKDNGFWETQEYNSLAELNEEWEDYKKYWYIDADGNTMSCMCDDRYDAEAKAIGNYFETKEEAEKAVEKLKAWKRLKDKGFRFTGWDTNEGIRGVDFEVPDSFFSEHNHSCISDETKDDLDLLFWSEE